LVDHDGYTPLTYAVVNGLVEVVLKLLTSHNAKDAIDKDDNRGNFSNCILLACEYGHLDVVRCLLDRHVPMQPDDAGFYPLHISCRKGHVEISSLLLDRGHDINICDKYHVWSPIFHAASQGHYHCVKLLVDRKCNLSLVDEDGWLPVTHAIYRGHLKTAALLDQLFSPCLSSKPFDYPFMTRISTHSNELEGIKYIHSSSTCIYK
jgi:CDK inhibitor PHO81